MLMPELICVRETETVIMITSTTPGNKGRHANETEIDKPNGLMD